MRLINMSAETELSAGTIYQAEPLIEINGQQNSMVQALLLGMMMNEAEGGLSSLQIRFRNTAVVEREGVDLAFEYSDMDLLSLGNSIKILAGDQEDPQEIFRGIISGLELNIDQGEQPVLTVLAEDALQKARMTRHTRLHSEGSLRDIAESIAAEIGLRAVINRLNSDIGPQMQLNESNLAFLRRLLNRNDADMQVVGDELHISAREEVRRNSITLELGSQLKRVRAVADLAHQVSTVTFSGWNVTTGQPIYVTSEVNTGLGPGTGRLGRQILAEAITERSEHIGDFVAADETEAQALVNARYMKKAHEFVRVEASAEGNPGLRVGTHVTLRGIGPRFENTYYVIKVCHRFDQNEGYQTDFMAESSYFGG